MRLDLITDILAEMVDKGTSNTSTQSHARASTTPRHGALHIGISGDSASAWCHWKTAIGLGENEANLALISLISSDPGQPNSDALDAYKTDTGNERIRKYKMSDFVMSDGGPFSHETRRRAPLNEVRVRPNKFLAIPVTVHLFWLGAGFAGPERSARLALKPIEKCGITNRPADLFRLAQSPHPFLILSGREQPGKVRIA